MLIHGIGTDIVEIDRVAALIAKWDERFLGKVFFQDEIDYCRSRRSFAQHFAARIAAKEAASKALGTGWRNGVHWKTVQIARQPGARPTIQLHGRAKELAEQWGVGAIHLTMSHSNSHAIADVLMERAA